LNSLNQYQNGNSFKSTTNSDSLGGRAGTEIPNQSREDKMAAFKQKMGSMNQMGTINSLKRDSNVSHLSGSNQTQAMGTDLNRSHNKAQAFESKMAML
jgi:hypothetical protein